MSDVTEENIRAERALAVIGAVIVIALGGFFFLRSRGVHPQQVAQWLSAVIANN